jgi:hypothetical protein
MKMRITTLSSGLAITLAAALVGGCGAKAPTEKNMEAQQIASELELDNGGLTTADEAPQFGEPSAYAEEEIPAPENVIADETESAPEVQTLSATPGAKRFEAVLLWGQIPPDFSNKTPHLWSGTVSVSRGALIVRHSIRFEDKTDHLMSRTDPKSVSFSSITLPANDGLRVTVIDPTPGAPEPLTLSYEGKDGTAFSAPISALLGGPVAEAVDSAGNRIAAAAIDVPVDVCQNGFLGGHWRRVLGERGRLRGALVDAHGDVMGHMRGIWGERKNGEKVFFGKFIDPAGHFRGIFAGHYASGHYDGHWVTGGGEVGKLGGMYLVTDGAGPKVSGFYLGRWGETSCKLNVGSGANVEP